MNSQVVEESSAASSIAYLKSVTQTSVETLSSLRALSFDQAIGVASDEVTRLNSVVREAEELTPQLIEDECDRRLSDNDARVRSAERTAAMLAKERDNLREKLAEAEKDSASVRRRCIEKVRSVELKARQEKFIHNNEGR